MAHRILIVDDEEDIREIIRYNLTKEGYEVYEATNGKEAISVAEESHPHLILLDMMMPVMDGRTACEAIRQHPQLHDVMIVFLSAAGDEDLQYDSYKAGADDYITKPIAIRILCSRINAIMKRIDKPVGEVLFNADTHTVTTPNGTFTLPRKEFEILQLLKSDTSRIFTREEIFSHVWRGEVVIGHRTLDVHIRRLRRKIGNEYIETYKGVGFKYNPAGTPQQ
jgi:two-component system alkaline phosphatase synthesis response regulator PhoP